MLADPPFTKIHPRTRRLGHVVLHVAETPSTMELARARAQAGAAEGLVVVAERQTAGVGRRGRTWTSVGSSLHATVLLRPQAEAARLPLLPLAAGVALAEAVRRVARVNLRLKWPNDVLHHERKVGGVLLDAVYAGSPQPDFVLIGLGVNGDAREEDFPLELRSRATSLSLAAGRHVCLPAVLKRFLEELEPRYDDLVRGRTERVWSEAAAHLATLRRRVRVHTPETVLEGEAVDLGPDGELLVRTAGAVHAVRAGDCEELRDA
jgi:BirA family transcriptional regulator, biotin operon repressor / biotin---[acetyl-CoA-carboxylase] ligase